MILVVAVIGVVDRGLVDSEAHDSESHDSEAHHSKRAASGATVSAKGSAGKKNPRRLRNELRRDAPLQLVASISGAAVVEVLGGVATTSVYLETAAAVWPNHPDADHVRIDCTVGLGLHLGVCWLVDMEFDSAWRFTADLARAAGDGAL